ncbi:MAG: MmgE/PrpD family protein [Chloroflexi bacterium]|nr:MmgE/PrpD family protein [Chloroflexota bacterium]
MNASERLARFVVETESVPEDAIAQAKRALLDTLGVTLAGSREESARIVADWVREQGGRAEVAVLGRSFRAPAADAALANGAAAHALDFDDVSLPMRGHPSAPLLPAALAVAEKASRSGRDLLTAFVLGFEVETSLGRAIGEAHYALGWHATSTLGTLGAAAACARLLRLDIARTQMAFGIAASLASGLQQNFGTMTKPLHAGWAARNGVVAAELAARGFTADRRALEGESGQTPARPGGFLRAMSGGAEPDLESIASLGRPYQITSSGFGVKLYPCCYAVHRSLDAVLEMKARHRIDPAGIEAIRVEVSRGSLMPLRGDSPATGLEGKFSLEYCLAAALLDGHVMLTTFTDEAVHRPAVRELMAKIEVSEGPDESGGTFPIGGYAEVRIVLRGGEEQFLRVDTPRGDPSRPLSWEELTEKFRDCAQGVLPGEATEGAVGLIGRLEEVRDLAELTGALTGAPAEARP